MRLLESIKLASFRRFFPGVVDAAAVGRLGVREASGVILVEIDESALRDMIHQAIRSKGKRCKAGPVHVRFAGETTLRTLREGETSAFTFMGAGGDDVYAGHVWASRPR